MRRTSASSQRKNFISPILGASANSSPGFSVDKYKFISKYSQNNTKKNEGIRPDHLQPLGNQSQNVLKTSGSQPELSLSIRRFNVVYGKQSKKKHKTWEGDGILDVCGKNITLKDAEDKIIGQSTIRKNEELSEGIRIFVGSKEVEILDPVEESVTVKKRPVLQDDNIQLEEPVPENKKLKLDSICCPVQPTSFSTFSRNNELVKKPVRKPPPSTVNTNSAIKPLIMPRPSEEHQWQCNVNHLPVTDVQVDYSLTKVLREHQREGVTFLYSCVTGLRTPEHTGAILADEMGLGKTLQCITLIWTLLNQGFYGGKPLLKRALIVVPSSLVKNWYNEFIRWIGSYRIKIFAVDKTNKIQNYSKSPFVPIVVISYEMFVKNYDHIKDIDFDLVVCDEGHRLKNSSIQATVLLSHLTCLRRILLTGTPLQNDLQEFYTLVNFVNPGILGSNTDFKYKFEKAIEESREPKASAEVIAKGEEKSKELMQITSNFMLRRTQSVIGSYLPPKHEHVIFCDMSLIQRKLYSELTDYCIRKCDDILTGFDTNMDHLSAIICLKKICNHPSLIVGTDFFQPSLINEVVNVVESSDGFVSSSIKLVVLDNLLNSLENTKEKIVLVSNFTQTLDILEKFCHIKKRKFARFDGSTPLPLRNSIVSNFNSSTSEIGILLLSCKAGGVGLNLIGASRLVLFDSDWNPATDLQAMSRIWRDGQKRNVFIYRLLTSGTLEEKIFQRQLKKAGLSESVVDPLSVSAVKLSKEELKDLFVYSEQPNSCTTHDALKCQCDGSGSIPGIPQESSHYKSDAFDAGDLDDFDLDIFHEPSQTDNIDKSNQEFSLNLKTADEPDYSVTIDNLVSDEQVDNLDDETDDKRDCEISFSSKKEEIKPKSLRMNQLFLWEHHCGPISSDVLKEIGLDNDVSSHINYLFRNKTLQ